MSGEVKAYKLFRQLEEREKRTNPYKFYDKDELIDEILKLEDKVEELMELYTTERHCKDDYKNIIKEVREYANTDKNCIPKHIKDYINNLLDKENK